MTTSLDGLRLDKWLWAARFCKTRSLAVEEIERGRASVNGVVAKPSRELRAGDLLLWRQPGSPVREVVVRGLSNQRGPAQLAQTLYEETAESLARRAAAAEQRRLAPEPSLAITEGRPTKRDQRRLAKATEWQRWSVSIDDER